MPPGWWAMCLISRWRTRISLTSYYDNQSFRSVPVWRWLSFPHDQRFSIPHFGWGNVEPSTRSHFFAVRRIVPRTPKCPCTQFIATDLIRWMVTDRHGIWPLYVAANLSTLFTIYQSPSAPFAAEPGWIFAVVCYITWDYVMSIIHNLKVHGPSRIRNTVAISNALMVVKSREGSQLL